MRNHSRQYMRTYHRQSGIPRTLSGERPTIGGLKESEIRVGKYKYDPKDELGRGFSGNVYKGVQISKQHKRYAIKVINLKKFKGHSLDMLQSEIQIHRSLNHQNVVKLYEVIKTGQFYYLVMEYCPHGNLSEYIAQKKQLSEHNSIDILSQLISAYKYLLTEGIIHRDIKPANILRVGNRWKLSDFGFSTKARFSFKDRVNLGTPLYMAPQTLKKNSYSFKSDFYAIGVVLFEMLTGETPYEARSEKQLIEKVHQEMVLPKNIKHPKLVDFLNRIFVVNEVKRMSKEDFQAFELGVGQSNCQQFMNSVMSSKKQTSLVNDQSSSKKMNNSTEMSLKGSKQVSRQQKIAPKNQMMINHEILTIQFQFVRHHYLLIQNIDCLNVDDTTKGTLALVLFKLLLKTMRHLCDKNQNHLNLPNWQEYQQCKLYQQLYSQLTIASEQYEKQYLEFIKSNDIKIIRTVNRKYPELCSNHILTSKFYNNLKSFIASVIKQHDLELTFQMSQAELEFTGSFQTLQSIFTLYQITAIRGNAPWSNLTGEKPVLIMDYKDSKMTRLEYNNLKRRIKDL